MQRLVPLAGLMLASAALLPAQAVSLAPLTLAQTKGLIQITNTSERPIRVRLDVFDLRQVQGTTTAALAPMAAAQAEALIRLRPAQLHLSPGTTRTISYRVKSPDQSFFVCGVSSEGAFQLRVCSRWRGSSASLPGAKRR